MRMNTGLLLGFLALSLIACGKYGPPSRSYKKPRTSVATPTPAAEPAGIPEEEEKSPL